jgi:glycosyltransferase involved in cell wall biosynthesis
MSLIIYAPGINSGGGLILLKELLKVLDVDCIKAICVLDKKTFGSVGNHIPVDRGLIARIKSEYWLFKNSRNTDIVLCFGNLPPLFKLKAKVVVYLQNVFVLNPRALQERLLSKRIKLFFLHHFFRMKVKNIDELVVQTPSMKLEAEKIGSNPGVRVQPFMSKEFTHQSHLHNKVSFIYFASGEPHKNHKNLIKAWILLASEGLYPKLAITIECGDQYNDLKIWLELQAKKFDLDIENLGFISHQEIPRMYESYEALIYPSLSESLGLPLVEANLLNVPILASELDFVRDVVDPIETFDPYSPVSISRAVKRYMNVGEARISPCSAKEFLNSFIETENH